uniref:hypothetical protein n=1 Tax=Psychrobacter sanguinis TaxID=861445 RepID=UPI001D128E6A
CPRLFVHGHYLAFFNRKKDGMVGCLQRFISITQKLLPNKHVLVTTNKELLSKLSSLESVRGIKYISDDIVSTYLVGVGIPNTVKDTSKKWKYSSVLRFAVHMFLIMDEDIPLKD